MKRICSLFLMLTGWFSGTAQQTNERYKDSVFSSVERVTVEYGSNINYTGKQETLLADVYSPANDTIIKRPIIIYVHGGGFRAGRRNDTACVELCKNLTKKGYVTASIDYRLGMLEASSIEQSAAVLRAVQDLNAFVRYTKANADSLNIDTSKIFITGSSAGGITVLAKAYIKIDSTALAFGISSTDDLEGETNTLPFNSSVTAVFSMWGALYNIDWLQKNDLPVGCLHSKGDSTIPYISGYNRQNRLLLLYGSKSIYERALSLGIPSFLHAYDSYKHDLGLKVSPYKDTTVQLIADFFYQFIYPVKEKVPVIPSDSLKQMKIDLINIPEEPKTLINEKLTVWHSKLA